MKKGLAAKLVMSAALAAALGACVFLGACIYSEDNIFSSERSAADSDVSAFADAISAVSGYSGSYYCYSRTWEDTNLKSTEEMTYDSATANMFYSKETGSSNKVKDSMYFVREDDECITYIEHTETSDSSKASKTVDSSQDAVYDTYHDFSAAFMYDADAARITSVNGIASVLLNYTVLGGVEGTRTDETSTVTVQTAKDSDEDMCVYYLRHTFAVGDKAYSELVRFTVDGGRPYEIIVNGGETGDSYQYPLQTSMNYVTDTTKYSSLTTLDMSFEYMYKSSYWRTDFSSFE